MRDLKKEDIDIKGLVVSLYIHRNKPEALKRKNRNAERHLLKRRVVSPDFIELLYKIMADEPIDKGELAELWSNLERGDKDFLSFLTNQVSGLSNTENGRLFHIHSAKSYLPIYQKIKMIEDGIRAGATNPSMYEEYTELVDRLQTSGQINKMTAVNLIRKLTPLKQHPPVSN